MRNKRKAETPPEGVRRSGRLRTLTDKKAAEEEVNIQLSLLPPQLLTHSEQAAVAMANESAAEKSATAPLGKPKRFRRPRQRKKCGFLNKLPGELRNNIYRHVLLQPEEIEVTPAGPGEPALLRRCNAHCNHERMLTSTKMSASVFGARLVVFTTWRTASS